MKEIIDPMDYAGHIWRSMDKGILLTTRRGEQVNTMTIGWGTLGREWSLPVFVAYVRNSRFTRQILDETGEFTVNIPMEQADRRILALCGTKSGRDMDKIRELGLHLEESQVVQAPGIRELPLTLECRVLFRNVQDESRLPEELQARYYSAINEKDFHIAYYGQILNAYLITD